MQVFMLVFIIGGLFFHGIVCVSSGSHRRHKPSCTEIFSGKEESCFNCDDEINKACRINLWYTKRTIVKPLLKYLNTTSYLGCFFSSNHYLNPDAHVIAICKSTAACYRYHKGSAYHYGCTTDTDQPFQTCNYDFCNHSRDRRDINLVYNILGLHIPQHNEPPTLHLPPTKTTAETASRATTPKMVTKQITEWKQAQETSDSSLSVFFKFNNSIIHKEMSTYGRTFTGKTDAALIIKSSTISKTFLKRPSSTLPGTFSTGASTQTTRNLAGETSGMSPHSSNEMIKSTLNVSTKSPTEIIRNSTIISTDSYTKHFLNPFVNTATAFVCKHDKLFPCEQYNALTGSCQKPIHTLIHYFEYCAEYCNRCQEYTALVREIYIYLNITLPPVTISPPKQVTTSSNNGAVSTQFRTDMTPSFLFELLRKTSKKSSTSRSSTPLKKMTVSTSNQTSQLENHNIGGHIIG